jgi:hypothetical protein
MPQYNRYACESQHDYKTWTFDAGAMQQPHYLVIAKLLQPLSHCLYVKGLKGSHDATLLCVCFTGASFAASRSDKQSGPFHHRTPSKFYENKSI